MDCERKLSLQGSALQCRRGVVGATGATPGDRLPCIAAGGSGRRRYTGGPACSALVARSSAVRRALLRSAPSLPYPAP